MKRKYVFAFYCTLLVPVGALAGIGVGRAAGLPIALTVVGTVLGFASAYLLLRVTSRGEAP